MVRTGLIVQPNDTLQTLSNGFVDFGSEFLGLGSYCQIHFYISIIYMILFFSLKQNNPKRMYCSTDSSCKVVLI